LLFRKRLEFGNVLLLLDARGMVDEYLKLLDIYIRSVYDMQQKRGIN